MDELERAGRALREAVDGDAVPSERVRARARAITRRRRGFTVAAVATVVAAASVGIGFAVRGGNDVGVHTIAPAGSSTTHTSVTRPIATSTPATVAHGEVDLVQTMPTLVFADASHGWRQSVLVEGALDGTTDGGRTWTTQLALGTGNTVGGIVAVDDHDAFALVTPCCDGTHTRLVRTTDGTHWSATRGAGLSAAIAFVAFVDPAHGWGLTYYGELVATADAGGHWAALAVPDTGHGAQALALGTVCPATPTAGWVATAHAVYRTDDDGLTWKQQATVPIGGGNAVLVCHGAHAAYASFDSGAGQHTGAFLRTDDGGAHWRVLTEDKITRDTPLTMPGFPDKQNRGSPAVMLADGTMVFYTGCYACGPNQGWVVVASPTDHFVIGYFDSTPTTQIVLRGATASDPMHVFVEVDAISGDGTGPRPTSVYASSDGGHSYTRRWTSP